MRLNLGCGNDKRKGYINIDIRAEVNPDLLHDLTQKLPYPDNSIDEIIAKDVVEHFSHHQVELILKDWYRVLKPNGNIYIQTPDAEAICRKFLERKGIADWKRFSYWMFGAQDYPQNYHKTAFNIEGLRSLLEAIGFKVEAIHNDSGTNIMCWARKEG